MNKYSQAKLILFFVEFFFKPQNTLKVLTILLVMSALLPLAHPLCWVVPSLVWVGLCGFFTSPASFPAALSSAWFCSCCSRSLSTCSSLWVSWAWSCLWLSPPKLHWADNGCCGGSGEQTDAEQETMCCMITEWSLTL